MRGLTRRAMLMSLTLMAFLVLFGSYAGMADSAKFDIEKAIAGAKTPADHEAIASYYEKEGAMAQAKAEEHRRMGGAYRNLAGKGQFQMEEHCHRLVQSYESVATATAALAMTHRQMAQEALPKK